MSKKTTKNEKSTASVTNASKPQLDTSIMGMAGEMLRDGILPTPMKLITGKAIRSSENKKRASKKKK